PNALHGLAPCICGKSVPDRRRQALLERSGAARADVDLVTLQPLRIGAFWPFFVHGNTDAGLPKALGKTQATDPASNDDHVKSHVRSMGRVVLTLHAPLLNRFSIGCLDGVEPEANFLLKMLQGRLGLGVWTCSGRNPRPTMRAGIRCRIGQRPR